MTGSVFIQLKLKLPSGVGIGIAHVECRDGMAYRHLLQGEHTVISDEYCYSPDRFHDDVSAYSAARS